MAVIDVPGFVADLKDHSVDHGFHVHDERHFVETYSLRQAWEVDLHPEDACGGPLDLHLALDGGAQLSLTNLGAGKFVRRLHQRRRKRADIHINPAFRSWLHGFYIRRSGRNSDSAGNSTNATKKTTIAM